jgi:hypothetical protein
VAHDHLAKRTAWFVVIAVYLVDPFLGDQYGAFLCSVSGFLRVLEDKIDVIVGAASVHFDREGGQGRAVAVMAAFMGNAGYDGAIGQGDGFIDGEFVEIRPESDFRLIRRGMVYHIKPFAAIYNLQIRVLPEKGHQMRFRPYFLI